MTTAPRISFAESPAPGALAVALPVLLEQRLLVQGSSGSGKTTLLFQLLQETKGRVQQIIIDKEGDYAKLRSHYTYLLVGQEGEVPLDLRRGAVETLLRRVLEVGADVIYDLSDMVTREQHEYVARLARWIAHLSTRDPIAQGSYLVVIDEAQHFAPESGKGSADSTVPLVEMTALARKRGFCPLFASTRLSHLTKSITEIVDNSLIGRSGTNDSKRAADVLDFDKKGRRDLITLKTGSFYAYGAAFGSDDPTLVTSRNDLPVVPRRRGELRVHSVAKLDDVTQIVAALGDLPARAADEVFTLDEAKKEITKLRTALTKAGKGAAAPAPPAVDDKAIREALHRITAAHHVAIDEARKRALALCDGASHELAELRSVFERHADVVQNAMWNVRTECRAPIALPMDAPSVSFRRHDAGPQQDEPPRLTDRIPTVMKERLPHLSAPDVAHALRARLEDDIAGGSGKRTVGQRILDALAHLATIGLAPTPRAILAMTVGYHERAKSYSNALGALRSTGHIAYTNDGGVALTDRGAREAQAGSPVQSQAQLHAMWLDRQTGPGRKILQRLIEAYPDALHRDRLAAEVGYHERAKSYSNAMGRLRSMGLAEYPDKGTVKATAVLFPMNLPER